MCATKTPKSRPVYPEGFAVNIAQGNTYDYYTSRIPWVPLTGDSLTKRLWSGHARQKTGHTHFQNARLPWKRYRNNGRKEPAPKPFLQRMADAPLRPQSFKYDRALGVEIECYGPSLKEKLPYWAREAADGSLSSRPNDGREYRVLLKRSLAEPRLYRLCQLLASHTVDRTCGLHVHLDMRGKTFEEVTKIARRLNAWLYALRQLVPVSRRDGNTYCKWGIGTSTRYHAVNLCSFNTHKTLEIRLHSGTVDYTKILAWVRLLELLVALPRGPRAKEDTLAALGELPLAEHDRAYWLGRHKQLNPNLYGATVGAETE